MWRASAPGSSGSQMMATCSPRFFRCRSMQLAETLRVPSSNHLIETSGWAKEQFLTREYGLIQSMRLPCSPQNVSGSLIEASYMARYIASSIKADSATLGKLLKDCVDALALRSS